MVLFYQWILFCMVRGSALDGLPVSLRSCVPYSVRGTIGRVWNTRERSDEGNFLTETRL